MTPEDTKAPREFSFDFKFGQYESTSQETVVSMGNYSGYGVHVVEYSALEEANKRIAELEAQLSKTQRTEVESMTLPDWAVKLRDSFTAETSTERYYLGGLRKFPYSDSDMVACYRDGFDEGFKVAAKFYWTRLEALKLSVELLQGEYPEPPKEGES